MLVIHVAEGEAARGQSPGLADRVGEVRVDRIKFQGKGQQFLLDADHPRRVRLKVALVLEVAAEQTDLLDEFHEPGSGVLGQPGRHTEYFLV